jgi:hypothetical protein
MHYMTTPEADTAPEAAAAPEAAPPEDAFRALIAVGAGSSPFGPCLGACGGASADTLARHLAPQRVGDPLGLGIAPGERPAAPPDPDIYDQAEENARFARSLLSEEERSLIDAEIEKDGFMTIDQVRALISENTIKGSVESGGLDPEIVALIDARINYKIFIAGDNIYTREGLYDHYPFHEFNVQPEAIFVQQELGVFPPRTHALKSEELEYVARDVGDESVDFVMIEDLVGSATRKDYKMRRAPLRVVKTKIYIGKERWGDFALLQRFFRGAVRVATAQIAAQADGAHAPLSMLSLLTGACGGACGGALAGRGGTPLVTDQAALDAERSAREAEIARREEALRLREEEQRRLAEEQRRLAEEQRRLAEDVQRRLDADMKRIEAMLAAVRGVAAPAPPQAPAPAQGPSVDEDDSVALG